MAADQIPARVVLLVDEYRPWLWRMARELEVDGFRPNRDSRLERSRDLPQIGHEAFELRVT